MVRTRPTFWEALNHYERHDGKQVTVRAVAFTDKNEDGLVKIGSHLRGHVTSVRELRLATIDHLCGA